MNIPHIPPGILGLTALAIIVWYVAEWMRCKDESQAMALVRNPLALFRLATERLWYNRRLVAILIAIWLGTAAVWRFVIEPVFYAELLAQTAEHSPTFAGGGPFVQRLLRALAAAPSSHYLWQALPRAAKVGLGYGGGSFPAIPIAFAILGGVLIRLWYRPPAWLPLEARFRLVWPIYLTVGALLVLSANGSAALFNRQLSPEELGWGFGALMGASAVVLSFLGAVLSALLYDVTLQVGSGKYWNLRRAVLASVDRWLPIAWLSLLLALPFAPLPFFQAAIESPVGFWFFRYVSMPLSLLLPALLACMLIFVPWIILVEKAGFAEAVHRNFQLIRSRWQDLLAFALRYMLVVAPILTVLGTLKMVVPQRSTADELISLAEYLLVLLLSVTIVVLYQEVRMGKAPDSRSEVAGHGA